MTLVIALNAVLVLLVLGVIVGLHAWAILSSRDKQVAVARVRQPQAVHARRRRRQTTARRLASGAAVR